MISLAYLKFWFKSSNEHGVHSPFVFNFITKGVYSKDKCWRGKSKKDAFVERVLNYFKPKKVLLLSDKEGNEFSNVTDVDFLKVNNGEYGYLNSIDIIYINHTTVIGFEEIEKMLQIIQNDSFLLVDKSNASTEVIKIWKQLVDSQKTTVTLDFYYFGFAFVRREQLKQNFFLRL